MTSLKKGEMIADYLFKLRLLKQRVVVTSIAKDHEKRPTISLSRPMRSKVTQTVTCLTMSTLRPQRHETIKEP